MRFFIALVLILALANVQVSPVMSNSMRGKFNKQLKHTENNPLQNCSAGPIEAVVRSTDLRVIKDTYGPEYIVSPRFIKMKVCGAMGRDLNIYAGTCGARKSCQPHAIRMQTHYFQVMNVASREQQYIQVEIDDPVACRCQ